MTNQEETVLKQRTSCFAFGWLLALALSIALIACSGSRQSSVNDERADGTPDISLDGALTVADAVAALENAPEELADGPVELVAYVNLAPGNQTSGGAQAGCPVAPDWLAVLTDQPYDRQFQVAGVSLPNEVPPALPALRLAIPYTLGIIDVPSRARLQGHFFHADYEQCPDAERIFVLESVVSPLPYDEPAPTDEVVVTSDWATWHDEALGIGLRYPGDWSVEVTRNQGSLVEARFQPPNQGQLIRLAVVAGPTFATEDGPLPDILRGDRQLAAMLGSARARLVDIVGEAGPGGHTRDLRLVMNYDGNTVLFSTRVTDGVALDSAFLRIYSAMAASVKFDQPVDVSDPLDPTLTAAAELGPGPFLGQAVAEQRAIAVSGLGQAVVSEARLVPERDARLAVPGSCRDFTGQPDGVWLVTVSGVNPAGQQARLLVFVDGVTGERLCQTDAPPAAP